jgi:antitoxin HicB
MIRHASRSWTADALTAVRQWPRYRGLRTWFLARREYSRLSLAKTFDRIYAAKPWGGSEAGDIYSGVGSRGSFAEEYCALIQPEIQRWSGFSGSRECNAAEDQWPNIATGCYSSRPRSFVVTSPAFPGLVTEGDTLEEARTMAQDAICGYLESLREDHLPIPCDKTPVKEEIRILLPEPV